MIEGLLKRSGALAGLLIGILILINVLLVGKSIAESRDLSAQLSGARFIVLSRRNASLDDGLVTLSKSNDRLTYSRSDTEFAASVLDSVHYVWKKGADVVLVKDEKGQPPVVFDSTEKVQGTLDLLYQEKEQASNQFFRWFLLAGLVVGALVGPSLYRFRFFLLGLLTTLAVFRWAERCATCETFTFFGIDAALFGAFFYAGLMLACLWPRSEKLTTALLPSLLAGCALWQTAAIASSYGTCIVCATIFGINAATAVAGALAVAGGNALTGAFAAPLKQKRAVSMAVTLLGFVLLVGAADLSQKQKSSIATSQARVAANVFIGKPISAVGIKALDKVRSKVVFIGARSCPHCVSAKRMLSPTNLPLIAVSETKDGVPDGFGDLSISSSLEIIPASPALLVVNQHGLVTYENYGWTEDPTWFNALLANLRKGLNSESIIK